LTHGRGGKLEKREIGKVGNRRRKRGGGKLEKREIGKVENGTSNSGKAGNWKMVGSL
jgi:hypothetical protein